MKCDLRGRRAGSRMMTHSMEVDKGRDWNSPWTKPCLCVIIVDRACNGAKIHHMMHSLFSAKYALGHFKQPQYKRKTVLQILAGPVQSKISCPVSIAIQFMLYQMFKGQNWDLNSIYMINLTTSSLHINFLEVNIFSHFNRWISNTVKCSLKRRNIAATKATLYQQTHALKGSRTCGGDSAFGFLNSPRSISAPPETQGRRPTQTLGDADETVQGLQPADWPWKKDWAPLCNYERLQKRGKSCLYSSEMSGEPRQCSPISPAYSCRCPSSSTGGGPNETVGALHKVAPVRVFAALSYTQLSTVAKLTAFTIKLSCG